MARGTTWWRGLVAAVALACVTTLVGCDGDDAKGDDPAAGASSSAAADSPEADADRAAASTYGTALGAWAQAYAATAAGVTRDQLRSSRPSRLRPLYRSVPQLAAATSDEPPAEYAVAAAIAQRVTGIVTELKAYDQGVDWSSYYDDYGYYLDHDTRVFDSMDKASNQTSNLEGDFYKPAYDRIIKQQLGRDMASVRRFQRQAARLPGRYGHRVLLQSAIAYQDDELTATLALQREYLAAIDQLGGYTAHRIYDDYYFNVEDYFATAILAPEQVELAATRSMARSLTSLAGLAAQGLDELPATAPTVGDTYRAMINARVTPAKATSKKVRESLNTQLWMLHRVRELEKTPDAAYQAARAMLLFQTTEDSRSVYERYLMLVNAWSSTFPGSTDIPTGRVVAWMEQLLAAPVPAPLEPARQKALAAAAKVKPIVDNLGSSRYWDRMGKQVEKALRESARALDGPGLPAQIKAAVAATRPTST